MWLWQANQKIIEVDPREHAQVQGQGERPCAIARGVLQALNMHGSDRVRLRSFQPTLDCMPMSVRFKMDLCGLKLSLLQWRSAYRRPPYPTGRDVRVANRCAARPPVCRVIDQRGQWHLCVIYCRRPWRLAGRVACANSYRRSPGVQGLPTHFSNCAVWTQRPATLRTVKDHGEGPDAQPSARPHRIRLGVSDRRDGPDKQRSDLGATDQGTARRNWYWHAGWLDRPGWRSSGCRF